MFLPVLLSYTKNVLNRSTHSKYEVKGNVILMIDEETVKQFKIRYSKTSALLIEKTVKSYSYTRVDGKVIRVSQRQRKSATIQSSYNVARIYERSPIDYKRPRSHGIRFPYYFNSPMIKAALSSMVGTKKFPIYCRIDNRGGLFEVWGEEQEEPDYWGTAKVVQQLAQTKNLDKVKWGELTIVEPVIAKLKHR